METTNLGVRPEGLTELSGDIKVTCNAGTFLPTDFSVLIQLTSGVDVVNTTTTNSTLTIASGATSISYPTGIPNGISFQVSGVTANTETQFVISGIRINANKAQIAGVTSVQAT